LTPTEENTQSIPTATHKPHQLPSTVTVFAAYYHGLSSGQKVSVPVQYSTDCSDVIRTVVKHLNKMVILKGAGTPVYTDDDLVDFYVLLQEKLEKEFELEKSCRILRLLENSEGVKSFIVKRRGEINGNNESFNNSFL
jgi:hypothetical protein